MRIGEGQVRCQAIVWKVHSLEHYRGETKHTYDYVYEFMKHERIRTDGLITHRFPYQEYKHAISLAEASKGKAKAIKVILQA